MSAWQLLFMRPQYGTPIKRENVQTKALVFNICSESRRLGVSPGAGARGSGWSGAGFDPAAVFPRNVAINAGMPRAAAGSVTVASVPERGGRPREPLGKLDMCHSHNLQSAALCCRYSAIFKNSLLSQK